MSSHTKYALKIVEPAVSYGGANVFPKGFVTVQDHTNADGGSASFGVVGYVGDATLFSHIEEALQMVQRRSRMVARSSWPAYAQELALTIVRVEITYDPQYTEVEL